jgi:hypothetical protein
MADEIRRDEQGLNRPLRDEPRRQHGSPLGSDPQESEPMPGDPREAQEPQEPRTTHTGTPGHEERGTHEETSRPVHTRGRDHDEDEGHGVVDELREAWDRMRGKK